MAARGKWALVALTCLAAVLAAATFAHAAQQLPKNGCSSDVAYTGSLTSPDFTPTSSGPNDGPNVTLQGWFEIESIDPIGHDEIVLEYSLPGDPDRLWQEFAKLNPTTSPGTGAADRPVSNVGLNLPPQFQLYSFELPTGTLGVPQIQVRVRFAAQDGSYNGFRGVGVDNIALEASPTVPTQTFETNGPPPWAGDSAPPSDPFWQVIDNSQNVTVKNPEVNPRLVTLPDSGALPATTFGSKFAWFGNVASGTFCGPDFANLAPAPDTTITSAPPASSGSNDATFEFTATEGAFFECQLDGGGFQFCSSPHTYPGLPDGTHTFEVRATNFAGNVDPTPATHTWTIRPAELSDLDNPTYGVDVNVDQVAGIVKVAVPTAAARAAGSGRASQKGLTFVPLSRGAPGPRRLVPRHAEGHGASGERGQQRRQAPARHVPELALPGPPVA